MSSGQLASTNSIKRRRARFTEVEREKRRTASRNHYHKNVDEINKKRRQRYAATKQYCNSNNYTLLDYYNKLTKIQE